MIDLTDIEEVGVYQLAAALEVEGETSRMVWLHRMAKAIIDPPHGTHPLILCSPEISPTSMATLAWLAQALRGYEPESLCRNLEPVKVSRKKFKRWCSPQFPLPDFWFRGKDRGSSTGTDLNDTRHYLGRKQKAEVTKAVFPEIEKKANAGREWHQVTEVRIYLKRKGYDWNEAPLIKDLKEKMKKKGIIPKSGPAFK